MLATSSQLQTLCLTIEHQEWKIRPSPSTSTINLKSFSIAAQSLIFKAFPALLKSEIVSSKIIWRTSKTCWLSSRACARRILTQTACGLRNTIIKGQNTSDSKYVMTLTTGFSFDTVFHIARFQKCRKIEFFPWVLSFFLNFEFFPLSFDFIPTWVFKFYRF